MIFFSELDLLQHLLFWHIKVAGRSHDFVILEEVFNFKIKLSEVLKHIFKPFFLKSLNVFISLYLSESLSEHYSNFVFFQIHNLQNRLIPLLLIIHELLNLSDTPVHHTLNEWLLDELIAHFCNELEYDKHIFLNGFEFLSLPFYGGNLLLLFPCLLFSLQLIKAFLWFIKLLNFGLQINILTKPFFPRFIDFNLKPFKLLGELLHLDILNLLFLFLVLNLVENQILVL